MTAQRLIRTVGVFACVAATAAIGLLGCDKSPTKPSSDTTRVVLTTLSVTGTLTATAIGQTIQLTATAAFSDKTTRNVTTEAQWTSLDPSVATVSPAGLVTILKFGVCNISAKFQSLTTTRQVSVIQPTLGQLAPFHISGIVADEDGLPLAGAAVAINYIVDERYRVRWTETSTDAQGRYEVDFEAMRNGYRIIGLTDVVALGYAHLDSGAYEKDLQLFASSTSALVGDFRLKGRVRLAAGDSSTITFSPGDSVCDGDASLDRNDICRYVRITVPADGTLTVSATPSNGAPIPYLLVIEDPISGSNACPCGSGTVTYPVRAGTESLIAMNIRRGFSENRSYAVTTVFRADDKRGGQ